MRSRFAILNAFLWMPVIVTVFVLLMTGATRAGVAEAQGSGFDPNDLSGIYVRTGGDPGFGPVESMPPLTAAGEAKLRDVILPGPSRHPLAREASNAAPSNDAALGCNPKGLPRLLLESSHQELIILPNRVVQIWSEERRPREIWIDGRPVPSPEDLASLGATWYGHGVGVWEGDTLVVNSVGIDDRAWLDSFGFPRGYDARVEERYRLVDANTLQVTVTLYDEEMYTRPWVSDVKTWRKESPQNVTRRGWYGLFGGLPQAICFPTE